MATDQDASATQPEQFVDLEELSYDELRSLATEYDDVDGSASAEEIRSQLRERGDFGDESTPVPVGVKLGSTRTVVAVPSLGEVDCHTTLTCMATYEDVLTGEEKVLHGEEAATEYPDRVEYMLRSGLPEDERRAEMATAFFQNFVSENDVPPDSAVVYAIPSLENEEGLSYLESVIENSDIGDAMMRSYPEPLCSSIPAMGDGLEAIEDIFVAVNMGSTNLEACAYRRGEQLDRFATGAVTGDEIDRRIATYIEEETQGRVNIDHTTAREYKEQHGDFVAFEPFTDVIQQPGGGAHEFTIEDSVMDALDEYVDGVVEAVANDFLPQLANSYMKTYSTALDKPVVLTGGMVSIHGIEAEIEDRLSDELQRDIDVAAPDEPVTAAARGARRIAERLVEVD
jgi:actin-like ATPase involved in cell morphogenesis